MENSFFEYRDVADSGSDEEFIDNSIIEESFNAKKKNHTVFVAESEESTDDESNDCSINKEKNISHNLSKTNVQQSNIPDMYVVSSSDDDGSRRGSIRKQSVSSSKLVVSSSDEDDKEQYSPEMVPRRKQQVKKKSPQPNDSIIGHKARKRIMLIDSDTDNSIVIEHDTHRKLKCLQDTPIKIGNNENIIKNIDEHSSSKASEIKTMNEHDEMDKSGSTIEYNVEKSMSERTEERTSNIHINDSLAKNTKESDSEDDSAEDSSESDDEINASSDDGPDEDQMVMSRATRMSIMGVIPKDNHNDSDDSDFIQSDESSKRSSTESLSGLPDVSKSLDETHLSPLYDVTNEPQIGRKSITTKVEESEQDQCIIIGETENFSSINQKISDRPKIYEDDVTIIESEPVIIALSSDDDELDAEKSPKTRKSLEAKKKSPSSLSAKKSPQLKPSVDVKKRSPKVEGVSSALQTIKKYMTPESYPNHEVRYVKKHERETELMKLVALQDELKTTNYILEEMDINSLPDGGSKLIERLTHLEMQVQLQGNKVANMIVEPENPTPADIARDGFSNEDGLSWDAIQKASNAVQPRMFGKQAMSTHMAERNLILDRLRNLYESLASRPSDSQKAKQPHGVATALLPHQLHALAWLRWRETQRPKAGILADDMGLGKTITMLALIVCDKESAIEDEEDDDDDYPTKSKTMTRGGTLVVCPASLMQQWGGEVTKHCKPYTLSVCLHHGPSRATQPNRLATHDLVCTTYNILQRDNEKNGVLMRIAWRRVILDEAHIVRNYKSATCGAVCSLRARRRWCLTGTPVQNKDLDLFALIKFLKCSPFDDLTMWKKWIDNKSQGGQERMNTMMQCLLLRRTKVQLQQKGQLDCLPERATHHRQVTLSKAEMNVYQKVLVFSKTLFAQFLHQRAEKNADLQGFTTSSANKNNEYDKMHKKMIALQGAKPVKSHEILVLLLRLRQVCCHCGLIAAMLDEDSAADVQEDPAGQDLLAELNKLSLEESRSKRKSNSKANSDEENNDPAQEGTTVTEAIRSVLSPNNPVFDLGRLSSKISAVMDCLKKDVFVHKGDKAVVVSQWTSVLRLVEVELKKAKIRSVTLSGNVAVNARPPLINALNDPNSDVKVMLLSLCAGGVGLNLCGANHLLLLDPHWNPQLEEQAQDRIYRVGQKKNVNIYRFMCVDTVEQSIRKLQEAKLEMAENVLTGAKNTNKSKLTIEDLKILFNMGQ